MNAEQMNHRIKKFILGWGKELRPEDRAPAPLTNWIYSLEAEHYAKREAVSP